MPSSQSTPQNTDLRPWYRQFWPWFLISIPGITVIYCIIMISVAIKVGQRDTLVSDSYYKDGLAINQQLERDQVASQLSLSANAGYTATTGILVELHKDAMAFELSEIHLELIHPTLSGKDQLLTLPHVGEGRYALMPPAELSGRWYLDLRDPANTWRLKGEWALPSSSAIQLEPPAQR